MLKRVWAAMVRHATPCHAMPCHAMPRPSANQALHVARQVLHTGPAWHRAQDHLVLSGDKKGQIAVWDWQKASWGQLAWFWARNGCSGLMWVGGGGHEVAHQRSPLPHRRCTSEPCTAPSTSGGMLLAAARLPACCLACRGRLGLCCSCAALRPESLGCVCGTAATAAPLPGAQPE